MACWVCWLSVRSYGVFDGLLGPPRKHLGDMGSTTVQLGSCGGPELSEGPKCDFEEK